MNNPEYILVDEFGTKDAGDNLNGGILFNVKQALGLPVLNYQYGYRDELDQTLKQYENSPAHFGKKFPLVWLVQPFKISRGEIGWYGKTRDLRIVFFASADKDGKAKDRVAGNFKQVLYPIYRETMKQITLSRAFDEPLVEAIPHDLTDVYYWGDEQKMVITDTFDALDISGLQLKISDNPNSSIFSNF